MAHHHRDHRLAGHRPVSQLRAQMVLHGTSPSRRPLADRDYRTGARTGLVAPDILCETNLTYCIAEEGGGIWIDIEFKRQFIKFVGGLLWLQPIGAN